MRIINNAHVKRALEVAIAGKHSILIVGNYLNTAAGGNPLPDNAYFVLPCPCGWLSDPMHECNCSIEQTKSHQASYPVCDIKVELVRPTFPDLVSAKIIPVMFPESQRLLEIAYNKLGLTVCDIVSVLSVAVTIQRMEQANNLQSAHIAEAIQYKVLK